MSAPNGQLDGRSQSPNGTVGRTRLNQNTMKMTFAALLPQGCKVFCLLALRFLPMAPQRGKWQRLGPAIDWWMLAMGMMGIVPSLWRTAYGKAKYTVVVMAGSKDDPMITQDSD